MRFPAGYPAVARGHPGGAPTPAAFDLPGGFVTAVAHLLHFADEPFMSNVVARRLAVEGLIKKGVKRDCVSGVSVDPLAAQASAGD